MARNIANRLEWQMIQSCLFYCRASKVNCLVTFSDLLLLKHLGDAMVNLGQDTLTFFL